MAELIVSEFVSLNGVMEAPGGEPSHPHNGWTFASVYGEDHYAYKWQELDAAESLLLGRTTFDGFAAAWPERDGDFADKFNSMPKYVVSSTLTDPAWNNSTVIGFDDVAGLRERLDGPILVNGSAQLVHALIEADLVDEYRAMIHPVLIDAGKQMFPPVGEMKKLQLVEATPYESGVLLAVYRPA